MRGKGPLPAGLMGNATIGIVVDGEDRVATRNGADPVLGKRRKPSGGHKAAHPKLSRWTRFGVSAITRALIVGGAEVYAVVAEPSPSPSLTLSEAGRGLDMAGLAARLAQMPADSVQNADFALDHEAGRELAARVVLARGPVPRHHGIATDLSDLMAWHLATPFPDEIEKGRGYGWSTRW